MDDWLTKTMTNYRPDPSLEGAPDWQTSDCQTATNIWSWAPDGARHQDWLTGWPSVVTWLWLWAATQYTHWHPTRRSKEDIPQGKESQRAAYFQHGPRQLRSSTAAGLRCERPGTTLLTTAAPAGELDRGLRFATRRPFPEPTLRSINIQRVCVWHYKLIHVAAVINTDGVVDPGVVVVFVAILFWPANVSWNWSKITRYVVTAPTIWNISHCNIGLQTLAHEISFAQWEDIQNRM
jgi:hypothetical protein